MRHASSASQLMLLLHIVWALVLLLSRSVESSFGLSCTASTTAQVPVQISKSPRIYIVDNAFTQDECAELIQTGFHLLEPAQIMGGDGKLKPADDYRSATTATLMRKSSPIVDKFRKRMANLILLPEEYGEELQLTRYTAGQKYEAHFDSSLLAGRLATVIIFLGLPEKGGELAFPWAKREEFGSVTMEGVSGRGRLTKELQANKDAPRAREVCSEKNESLLIQAKLGRAVLWFNHSPDLKRVGYEAS